MSEYLIKGETLSDIAGAIRSKTGSSDSIDPVDMASLIYNISSGGEYPDTGSDFYVETGMFYVRSDVATSWSFECPFEPTLLFIHAYSTSSDTFGVLNSTNEPDVITWLSYVSGRFNFSEYTSANTMDTYSSEANKSSSPFTLTYTDGTVTIKSTKGYMFADAIRYHWIAARV